ncbi:MAG: 30S ribosomal protein S24e [Candidatus Thermoplasmatota archaeon]|nr:30S ribosomal protein S24e [Candidatus Thermoplasmatota archaeon]
METELLSRKENPLFERIEVEFRTRHASEPTPTRDALREEIAKIAKAKKDLVIIDRMNSDFGRPETTGYAKIYKSKDRILSVERKHILIRNGLLKPEKEPAKKKPEPRKAPAEAEKREKEAPAEPKKRPKQEAPAEAEKKKKPEAAKTKPEKESKEG